MAPNDRQERRRMRERGAGITRDLKNTNFAFTFGSTVLNPQRSSRKTPQPATRRSTSKQTPASTHTRSVRKTPAAKSASKEHEGQSRSVESQTTRRQSIVAPSTARSVTGSKRKSKTPGGVTPRTHVTPSLTGKRKRDGTPVIIDLNEEDELEHEDVMESITGRRSWGEQIPAPRRQSSLGNIAEIETGGDELEQADSAHDISNTSRLSLGGETRQTMETFTRPSSRSGQKDTTTTTVAAAINTPAPRRHSSLSKLSHKVTGETEVVQEGGKENETHSTYIRRMYKPRQPLQAVDGPSKQRKSLGTHELEVSTIDVEPVIGDQSSMMVLDEVNAFEASIDLSLEDVTNGASTINDSLMLSATRLDLSHSTPLFLTPNDQHKELANADVDVSPVRGRKRRRTRSFGVIHDAELSSVAAKPTSKKSRKTTTQLERVPTESEAGETTAELDDRIQEATTTSQRQGGTTVPITVYRLTKLPTLDEDDELNDDAGVSNSVRLPAVNAVDVLTQITTEVIEHMAETAHRLPTTTVSRTAKTQATARKPDSSELKRKRAILHHFKQSLSDALFDITTTLDAGSALSTRLRALTKEKIQFREELLAVRKQREDIALKIDRVRREHTTWREKTTNTDELSADLWDLEMAVKRGREECGRLRETHEDIEEPRMGLSMLAAVTAEAVGRARDGGGICGKVEHLNHTLENAADVLEGRTS